MGPRGAAGGAERPRDRRPPPRCPVAIPSTALVNVSAKKTQSFLFPHVAVCFSLCSQTHVLPSAPSFPRRVRWRLLRALPRRRREEEERRRLRRAVHFPSLYIDLAESVFQSLLINADELHAAKPSCDPGSSPARSRRSSPRPRPAPGTRRPPRGTAGAPPGSGWRPGGEAGRC